MDTRREQFLGDIRGDSEPARRVLGIGDHKFHSSLADKPRHLARDSLSPWLTKDLADE